MHKNKILLLGVIITLLLSTTIIIYYKMNSKKKLLQDGGFNRKFLLLNDLTLNQKIDLEEDNYKFIGIFQSSIYIQSYKKNIIYSISDSLPLIYNSKLDINKLFSEYIDISNISFDDKKGEIYIFSESSKKIFIYNLKSKTTKKLILPFSYSKGYHYRDNEIIFLTQSKKDRVNNFKFTFQTLTFEKNNKINIKNKSELYLNAMIDDGNLNISSDNRIVYNSFYKNSFYVLDSNLKSIYNGKFIDTITKGPAVNYIGDENNGRLQYSTPIRMCNPSSKIRNNILLVHSQVIANNDVNDQIKKNMILDCYKINERGKYIGSFYVPISDNRHLIDFFIVNDKIFLLYSNTLLIYDFQVNINF